MGKATHGGLDSPQHHGRVRVQSFQYLGVYHSRVVWPHVVPSIGTIRVLTAQPSIGRIAIDHRVHATWRDTEEQAGSSQFPEVPEVSMPVGLRYDGDLIACRFKRPAYHSRPESGVVYISVG